MSEESLGRFAEDRSRFKFIEEATDTINECLIEFLNNKEELFADNSNDYYNGLIEKIHYIKANRNPLSDLVKETITLENSIYEIIHSTITLDYQGDDSLLDGPDRISLLETIYYHFYLFKRRHMVEFLVNYIFTNKKTLSESNTINKKDVNLINLNQILPSKNIEYLGIINNYKEIIIGILEANISLEDFIDNIELTESERDIILQFFEVSDMYENYKKFIGNLTESEMLDSISIEVRNTLIEVFNKI